MNLTLLSYFDIIINDSFTILKNEIMKVVVYL